jgi:hypothetical protein
MEAAKSMGCGQNVNAGTATGPGRRGRDCNGMQENHSVTDKTEKETGNRTRTDVAGQGPMLRKRKNRKNNDLHAKRKTGIQGHA